MPPFTPDSRNLGGRSLILNLMFNHRQYVNSACSQMHTSRTLIIADFRIDSP